MSFFAFNLGTAVFFFRCDIRILYKIIDKDTEHYLSTNVWIIVIYNKGNSHCQMCHFCVVDHLRKTLIVLVVEEIYIFVLHVIKYLRENITNSYDHWNYSVIVFLPVRHKCSSQSPCPYGGVCEAVDWIYQCNCTGTNHYGPRCETGTKYSNLCQGVMLDLKLRTDVTTSQKELISCRKTNNKRAVCIIQVLQCWFREY